MEGRTTCVLDVAGLTEGRLRYAAPRSQARNSRPRVSSPLASPLASPSFRAEQESLVLAALHCRSGPKDHPIAHAQRDPGGCGPIASGLSTAIEVAVVAARETHGDDIMATIGTFTSNANGLGCASRSVL